MKKPWAGRHLRVAIAVLCFGAAAQSPARQPQTGQITGHVIDVVGAVIPRANVFVRKNAPSEEEVRLITRTDINGDFTLILPEGGYDVLITSPGFAASVHTIPVLHGETRKIELRLKVLSCDFPGMHCDTFK